MSPAPELTTRAAPARPRVVVTTDPEPDDLNSMLRFPLYSRG